MDIKDATLKDLAKERPDLVDAIKAGEDEGRIITSILTDQNGNIVQWIEKKQDLDNVLISKRVDDYYFDKNEIETIAMHWYEKNVLVKKKIVRNSFDTTKYYVSNDGNDSWDGHFGQPWKTIGKINSTNFNLGDSILLKKGDVWKETLDIQSSGSADNPLCFGTYGNGEKPILNGADDLLLGYTWHLSTQGTNNYYVTPAPPAEVKIVYADDKFLLLDDDIEDSIIAENHYFCWADNDTLGYNTLYVRDISGIPGGSGFITIEGGQRNHCFYLYSNDYITIDGIKVRSSNQIGITITGTSNSVVIKNCEVFGANHKGISTSADTQNCDIDNCVITHTCPHKTASAKSGISLAGSSHIVQNCIVESNGLPNYNNNPDSSGDLYDTRGISVSAENSKIINNILKDNTGACIEGYGAINCEVTKNINYSSFGPEWKYGCNESKLFYNIWLQEPHTQAPSVIPNGGGSYGDWGSVPSFNLQIYNNLFFDRPSINLSDGSTVTLKNNIFMCARWYQVYADQILGLTMNNNYFTSDCQGYPDIVQIGGITYTLTEWQIASGQDVNSKQGAIVIGANYELSSDSICIDAGANVDLMEDFDGNSIIGLPDIGAFEYISKK